MKLLKIVGVLVLTLVLTNISCGQVVLDTEDFESYAAPSTMGFTFWNNTAIGDQWDWEIELPNATNSGSTGPLNGTGHSQYLYCEMSSRATGDEFFLISDSIDPAIYQLTSIDFEYHMFGADMGDLTLEYSTTGKADGDFTVIRTISGQQQTSETQAYNLISETLSGIPNITFLRFVGIRGAGFTSDIALDNIVVRASTCTNPTVNYTIVDDCGNGQFSIDVNVSNLGDATAVDISDKGITGGLTNVGVATHSMGPYTAGDSIKIIVDGNSYGGCADSSAKISEACECANLPVATVNGVGLDCGPDTFNIQVTVTNFGDGTSIDIYVDNSIVQSNAVLSNTYTFTGYTTGNHDVEIRASGAGFVTCNEQYSVSLSCNNDECAEAFGVSTDGTPTTSLDVTTYSSSGTNLSCDAGGGTEDAYYSFIAPESGVVLIDVDDSGLSGTNSDIIEGALFDACAGTEVDCFGWNNTNFFGSFDAASNRGRVVMGLTPGNTYLLEIEHYNNDWTGTYSVVIRDYAPVIEAGTQYCLDLTDAISLYDVGSAGEEFNCSMFGSPEFTFSDEEEYLLYTPSSNQTVDVVISSASYDDADGIYVGMFEWTPGVGATCLGTTAGVVIDAGATDAAIRDITLTAGTQYVIVVAEDYNDGVSACVQLNVQCGSTSSNSIATVDCGAGTYTGRLNFSLLGSANSYNLEADNGITYSGISTSTDYDFAFADLANHSVVLKGFDASMNLVCEEEVVDFSSGCNGTETCAGAPDITNTCVPGDLSGAINEGTLSNNPLCGNGTFVRTCAGGFSPSSNYEDIWYQIDNSGGSNTVDVSFTGLSGSEEVIVFLYDGGCTDAELLDHGYQNPVTTSVTAPGGSPGGTCAIFNSGNPSMTFYNLTAVSTIYVRVMPYVGASNCTGLVNADFTICATVPLPNDVSTGILQYNDAVTPYTVVNSSFDIEGNSVCQNMNSATISGTSLPADCGGTSFNLGGRDLWYYVEIPDGQIDTRLELSVTFDNAGESVYAIISDGPTSNQECTVMSSASAGETVVHEFDKTISEGGAVDPNHYFIRLVQPATNGITSFCVTAKLLVPNDKCDIFESTVNSTNGAYALFDRTTNTPITVSTNYRFTSSSGITLPSGSADPGYNDLWFSLDSRNFSFATDGDNLDNVYSRDVQININSADLDADQRFTFAIYYNPAYSSLSNDCSDLGLVCYVEGQDALDFVVDGYITLPLNHLEGSYILRVIQTAGANDASFDISANSSPQYGKPNSNCDIFTSSILSGPIYDITGDTLTGDFDLAGIDCNRNEALWYRVVIPSTSCPDISSSTEVKDVTIGFLNTQTGFGIDADVNIELYQADCNTLVPSSVGVNTTLSGNNETDVFPVNSATTYYLKVMPNSSGNRPTDYDVYAVLGPPRPCNDRVENAEAVASLSSGVCDRSALPVYDASGASPSSGTVSGANDVWFRFTQPDNADEDGYLSVLLVNQTNGSGDNHTMSLEVYDGGVNDQVANRILGPVTTNSSNEVQLDGGHMTVGKNYWIRIYHSELPTEEVKYSLCAYEAPSSLVGCPSTSTAVTVSGAMECDNDCKQRYRIYVPDNLQSAYWRFEVIANEPIADPLVFGQGSTSPSGEGSTTDYDLPCNPSMGLAPMCCTDNGTITFSATASCPTPSGKYVVANLIGASDVESNYYYLQVEHNSDLLGCGGLDICEINVVGPFGSAADAATGNTANLTTCSYSSPMTISDQSDNNPFIENDSDQSYRLVADQDKVYFQGKSGSYNYMMLDAKGRLIASSNFVMEQKGEYIINLPDVTTGLYFLKVIGERSSIQQKILVK